MTRFASNPGAFPGAKKTSKSSMYARFQREKWAFLQEKAGFQAQVTFVTDFILMQKGPLRARQ